VIAAAEESSETANVVRSADAGLVVPPGRPELLAQAIRRAYDGELDLKGMGERGRAFVTEVGDRRVAIGRYRALLHDLVGAS
jgi:hypothetical protein